jgi:hypothetical protein
MTPEAIEQFLEDMRDNLGFKSYVELAKYLDVDPLTLWRWRQGQLDITKQRLITYLLHQHTPAETAA